MKEISLNELRQERENLLASLTKTADTAKAEERMLNDAENEERTAHLARISEIDAEITKRESLNKNKTAMSNEKRASLRRILANKVNGCSLTEADEQLLQRGTERHGFGSDGILIPMESRTALSMGSYGTYGVQTEENPGPVLPLENKLALVAAGARYMTGLKGDINMPVFGAASVAWKAETGSATDGTPTISNKTFSPHRLTGYFDISKQMLIQENFDIETLLTDLITTAIAEKVDSTALGSGASVSNTPDGICGGTRADYGSLSWAKVVGLEEAIETAGALHGNLAYVGHPKLTAAMKTNVKTTYGNTLIITEGQALNCNGYEYISSANVASGLNTAAAGSSATTDGYGLIFGDWSKYFLGNWGSADIVVDPYSQAGSGLVRLVVSSFWDFGAIQSAAIKFAALK